MEREIHVNIDREISGLLELLNTVPFVQTLCSCGGIHRSVNGEVPEAYIEFRCNERSQDSAEFIKFLSTRISKSCLSEQIGFDEIPVRNYNQPRFRIWVKLPDSNVTKSVMITRAVIDELTLIVESYLHRVKTFSDI